MDSRDVSESIISAFEPDSEIAQTYESQNGKVPSDDFIAAF
jgi:hypothetical protein